MQAYSTARHTETVAALLSDVAALAEPETCLECNAPETLRHIGFDGLCTPCRVSFTAFMDEALVEARITEAVLEAQENGWIY